MNRQLTLVAVAIAVALFAACTRAADSAAEIARIKAEAIAAHPTDPVAAAKAANEALERLAIDTTSISPKEVAALVFLGYYSKNANEIPAICSEQGVDIGAFSSAFIEANKEALQAAASVIEINAIIERARASARRNGRDELERFARAENTDLGGACNFIKEHASEFASGTRIASIMPKIYEQLVGK